MAWGVIAATLDAQEPILELDSIMVSAERRAFDREPFNQRIVPHREPFATDLADLLANDPSFAVYRREGALQANPTAQGISLSNIGATATSRTLVLRNGVPQNDPFGSWVPWMRFRQESLASASMVAASNSLAWGSGTAGGAILLEDISPRYAGGLASVEIGHPGIAKAYVRDSVVRDDWAVLAEAFGGVREGFVRVHPNDRGPIDTEAHLDNFGGRVVAEIARSNGRWLLETSAYGEERGNGLPQANNRAQAFDFSARRQVEGDGWFATALAYGQVRRFENTFAAVDAARTADRVVLDQFSVPSWSGGGSLTIARELSASTDWLFGIDGRWADGETNERFFNDGTRFRRQREGGGSQQAVGGFSGITQAIGTFDISATARLDYWRLADGRLVVEDLTGGPAGSTTHFANRDDLETSGQFTIGWEPNQAWRYELGASHHFRLPTINELYRPFRIGNDTTLANAALEPEAFTAFRASAMFKPEQSNLEIRASALYYYIDNAIANVTINPNPAGSTAQRLNVPESTVKGLELGARYELAESWAFDAAYFLSQAEFDSSVQGISLAGRAFPLSPEHRLTASIAYECERWMAQISGLYEGKSFDDTNHTRQLPDALTVDAGLQFSANQHTDISLQVTNLFDKTVVSAEQASGLRFIAPGRSATITISRSF